MAPALNNWTALSGEVYTPSPVSSRSRAPSLSGAVQGIVPILPTLTSLSGHFTLKSLFLHFLFYFQEPFSVSDLSIFWTWGGRENKSLHCHVKLVSFQNTSDADRKHSCPAPVLLTASKRTSVRKGRWLSAGAGCPLCPLPSRPPHLTVAPCLPPPPWSSMVPFLL